MPSRPTTYRDAGVDRDRKAAVLAGARAQILATRGAQVLGSGEEFGGLFHLAGYRDPVVVSSIDSVGTKVRLAVLLDRLRGVGADIVAHGANDVLCHGARPLFMLDYVAASRLDSQATARIIEGIAQACAAQDIVLIGGETAEMPGVYAPREIDVVGCTVGAVERDELITGEAIQTGDAVIGLGSDGLHTNGYSLARAVLLPRGGSPAACRRVLARRPAGLPETLGDALLRPHRAYAKPVLALRRQVPLHGIAHITGGGIPENLERILPQGRRAAVLHGRWPVPPVFALIRRRGRISDAEMFRTFNMGLGLLLVVPSDAAESAVAHLTDAGERAWVVGEITPGPRGVEIRG